MVIISGPAQVVECGAVTTFFGTGLVLEVEGATPVIFEFLEGESGAAPQVASGYEGGAMRLTLTGFGTTEGRGSAQPVLVSAIGDDLLFLHFRVFRYGKSVDYTVHYTFFRVAREIVGPVELPEGSR